MDAKTQQVIEWMKQNGRNYAAWSAQDAAYKQLFAELPRFGEGHRTLKEAVVLYVGAEASQFEQGEFNVVVYVYDEQSGCGDFWRGSLANSYGQNSSKTRKEKTLEVLERCGIKDLRNLYSLIGQTIPVWINERTSTKGNSYYVVATIGSTGVETAPPISLDVLFGGNLSSAANPVAPPMPAAAPTFVPCNNPFAK